MDYIFRQFVLSASDRIRILSPVRQLADLQSLRGPDVTSRLPTVFTKSVQILASTVISRIYPRHSFRLIEVANSAVAMDAQAAPRCYPRGSFYPLSPDSPTRNRGITKTCFRTSSSCHSHYQAGLRLCTSRPISIRPKPTFVRRGYSFRGDLPSQTTHQTLSLSPSSGALSKN